MNHNDNSVHMGHTFYEWYSVERITCVCFRFGVRLVYCIRPNKQDGFQEAGQSSEGVDGEWHRRRPSDDVCGCWTKGSRSGELCLSFLFNRFFANKLVLGRDSSSIAVQIASQGPTFGLVVLQEGARLLLVSCFEIFVYNCLHFRFLVTERSECVCCRKR